MDCKTYRYEGHEVGDPWELYRNKQEVEEWKRRDPITTFGQRLIEEKTTTQPEIDRIEKEVIALIDAAVDFAKESPSPELEEAFEDVFVNP